MLFCILQLHFQLHVHTNVCTVTEVMLVRGIVKILLWGFIWFAILTLAPITVLLV